MKKLPRAERLALLFRDAKKQAFNHISERISLAVILAEQAEVERYPRTFRASNYVELAEALTEEARQQVEACGASVPEMARASPRLAALYRLAGRAAREAARLQAIEKRAGSAQAPSA